MAKKADENKELAVQDNKVLQAGETVETRVALEVKKFDVPSEKLKQYKKLYSGLKIFPLPAIDAPPEAWDAYQKSYDQVDDAIKVVRPLRTGTEKKRKEINADYIKIKKGIDEYAEKIENQIAEIEDPLQAEKKLADEARAKRDAEIKQAEEQLIQSRVSILKEAGLVFNEAGFYGLEDIQLDIVTIKGLTEEPFNNLVEKVKAISARIKAEKDKEEAEQRQRDEDAKKLQEDNEKAAAKIQKDADDLQKQRDALKKQTVDFRKQQLEGIRMVFSTVRNAFVYKTESGEVAVEISGIENSTNEDWANILDETTRISNKIFQDETKRLAEKADEDAKEQRLQNLYIVRSSELKALGVNLEAGVFKFMNASVPAIALREQTEDEWKTTLESFNFAIDADKKAKKEAEDRLQYRVNKLFLIGCVVENGTISYCGKFSKQTVDLKISDIAPLNESDWVALLENTEFTIKQIKEEDEAEQQRIDREAEQKRVQGLSDLQKVAEYAENVLKVPFPELSIDCVFKDNLDEIVSRLQHVLNSAKVRFHRKIIN